MMSAGRKEKVTPGKRSGSCLAQLAHVVGGRAVILAQLDLDVAVLRADRAGVVVGHVDAADRHADIVDDRRDLARRDDLADRLLDVGELVALSSIRVPTGARTCIRIWPASTDGKKLLAEEGHQQERGQHEGQEAGDEDRRGLPTPAPAGRDSRRGSARNAPRTRAGTGPADCATQACRRSAVLGMRLQQVDRHRRHQRARQDEGADHGEHHRHRHRHEQEARRRRRGRTSARRRCRCRAARRRPASRSARAPSMMAVSTSLPCSRCQLMFSMVTVASSTRMPTASARPPSVMMLSVSPIAASSAIDAQDRERDRDGDDHGRAPAAEEQQDHQAGQRRGDHAFVHHAARPRPSRTATGRQDGRS